MKISVVTASYNSEATIGFTIESFLRQKHPEKELLVVDGASRDATLKIVESFGSSAIRVFSEPDKGVYDAMNKGFRLFSGDAIGFLNSDDTFHDDDVLGDIASGLAEACGYLTALRAFQGGDVSVVSPLVSTYGLVALVLAALFLRDLERVSLRVVLAAALIVSGVFVVMRSVSL